MQRVTSKAEPGSIILFHNNAERVEEYLPVILKELQAQEYEIVPIGQLIYKDNYEIDNTGKQISNH